MEAGVRTLEREIGAVCRFKAVEFAEGRDADDGFDTDGVALPKGYIPEVKVDDLETILGIAKYEPEVSDEISRPGVAIGMAYQGSGNGGLLHVEAASWPGKGDVRMTGSLGEVISESAELAVSWVRGNACVYRSLFRLVGGQKSSRFPRTAMDLTWRHRRQVIYWPPFRSTSISQVAVSVKMDLRQVSLLSVQSSPSFQERASTRGELIGVDHSRGHMTHSMFPQAVYDGRDHS
jgi:Lon protease (S16) C-terminal proteolytic domain